MINLSIIPPEVVQVLNQLHNSGYQGYLVGGSVRDLVLGKDPKDFDICTNATPDEVKKIFGKVIETGVKFGTVTVLTNNNSIEVTTFRKSSKINEEPEVNKHVISATVEEDVLSRDYTINGLLFDGEKVIDLVGGLADLSDRSIKAIGGADERFIEDPLRMIRGIRLSCQLDFHMDDSVIKAIVSNVDLIERVAVERIREELIKILLSKLSSKGFRLLQKTGLLKKILPELEACYKFDQKNIHHDKDVFDHIMAVIENTREELVLRLAALLHDIGKPVTFTVGEKGVGHFYGHNLKGQDISTEILTRYKFDKKTIEVVGKLVREHMSKLQIVKRKTVKRLINRVGKDNIYTLIDLQIADEAGSASPHNFEPFQELRAEVDQILASKEPLEVKDLVIGGKELKELGIRPGPEMGKILRRLLEKVLADPELNQRSKLIGIAQKEGSSVGEAKYND